MTIRIEDTAGQGPLVVRRRSTEAALEVMAMQGIRALLELVGEDPYRDGLAETPARVVKAYREMCGRPGDPAVDLAKVFPDVGDASSPVTVGPIPFTSVCEHHLLPFTGTAYVAYVPDGGRIVGLSKLPRTVQHYAKRPQVQERMTSQIAQALTDHLNPLGVAVLVRGQHSCMSLRGACASGWMTTHDLRGVLDTGALRNEFMTETQR